MPETILRLVQELEGQENVRVLTLGDLEGQARSFGRATVNESLCFYSNVRNRSAAVSVVIGSEKVQPKDLTERQKSILGNLHTTLEKVKAYLKLAPLICVKRTIGLNDTFNPKCTLFLSTQRADNIRQAYLWSNTLRDNDATVPGPNLYQIVIPEWPDSDRQVLMFPEKGLNLVLGSDYVGEVKMGFLRMAMWEAKQREMLSLHAGSKLIFAKQKDGQVNRYGMLLFGLSGTGKSTHSCHVHDLTDEGEGIEILQDDIVFLQKDGSALGTERGFYLKTEGVNQESQPIIFNALSGPDTLFENVMVDSDGRIDFTNLMLGGNGRAVIPRESMRPYTQDQINLPPLKELDGLIIGFITRRMTVLPIVSKLNPEQAAGAFMLGESVETSAGDPRRAGESVRVVGTNPFIIGDPAEEGNWFYDFIKRNEGKVHCYLLNTGGIGEIREVDKDGLRVLKQEVSRFAIEEVASIIKGIARGSVEWEKEASFGSQIPGRVNGLNLEKFKLNNYYSDEDVQSIIGKLKQERREWLEKFDGLRDEVKFALSRE